MKKMHGGKTAYHLKIIALCGTLFLGALAVGITAVKKNKPAKAAPTKQEESGSGLGQLVNGKLSQEEYEELVDAEYKESGGMVRFGSYRKRYDVRKTTLFVGTYLIEFSALNETYYRLANLSKTQHTQNIEFYKSELQMVENGSNVNDVWAELMDANLSSLTTGAKTEEENLDEYWISCVITDDGVFDPKTGEIKDLMGENLYDLINLPELAPLKVKYDEIEEKAGRTEDETLHNYYTRNTIISIDDNADPVDLEIFKRYENNGRNDITNRCDIEINALKAYQGKFSGEEDDLTAAKAAAILDLYAREDAKRRVEIYKFLSVDTDERVAALTRIAQMIQEKEEEEDSAFTMDENYINAIEESLENCKKSYDLYTTMMLTKGSTVISEYRYTWSEELLDSAYNGKLNDNGEKWLLNILAVNNIGAGEIKMSEAEQQVLQTYLIPEGIKRYENKVLTEVTREYTKALAEGKSEDAKKDILMDQYNDAVKQMQELEFLVKATCDRKEKEYAISFIKEQIELATLWKTLVFDDPYGPLADYCIDLYIDWLNNLYKEIVDGDSDFDTNGIDPDELEAEKERAKEENNPEKLKQLELLEEQYGSNGRKDTDSKNGGTGDEGPAVFGYSVNNMTPQELLSDLGERLKDDLKRANYSIYDAVIRGAADAGFDPNAVVSGTRNGGEDGEGSGRNTNAGDGDDDDADRNRNGVGDGQPVDDNDSSSGSDENRGRNYGGGDQEGTGTDGNDDENGDNASGRNGNGTGSDDGNNGRNYGGGDSDGNDDGRNDTGTGSDPAADGKNRKNRRDNENYGRNYGNGDEEGDGSDKPWKDISAYGKDLDNEDKNGSEEDRSDEEIEKAIEDAFGKSFGELDAEAQAAVVVALNRYGKMHNATNCLAYARKLLTTIMNNKNTLVYAQYQADQSAEYINLGAVDYSRIYTGFRYVFIDGVDTITQISGTAAYSFAGNRVTNSNGETQDLTSAIGYQIDDYVKRGTRFPYINETDSMKYMVESGEYIVDTDWGIVVTATMELQVSKIIEMLTQAAS